MSSNWEGFDKTTPMMRKNNRDARSLKFKGNPPKPVQILLIDLLLSTIYLLPTYLVIFVCADHVVTEIISVIMKIYCIT